MSSLIYNSFKKLALEGNNVDFVNNDIKIALVTSAYIPNQDTHAMFSDITNEVVGTGYTAGGESLTTKVVAQDNTLNRGTFMADNVNWPSSTITARGAVIYKNTGTPSSSPIIGYFDFGVDKVSLNETFTIQWSSVNKILFAQ